MVSGHYYNPLKSFFISCNIVRHYSLLLFEVHRTSICNGLCFEAVRRNQLQKKLCSVSETLNTIESEPLRIQNLNDRLRIQIYSVSVKS
jgi:hypothetical protein